MAEIQEEFEIGGWLITVLALLALLALSACEKKPSDAPKPRSELNTPVTSAQSSITPPVADPSVPPAATIAAVVNEPAASTAKDAPANKPVDSMTKAQESNAMPMPGQVNNHSTTALDPVKRGASAP